MNKPEEFHSDKAYQPELEGFEVAYTPQPGDRMTPEKIAYFTQAIQEASLASGQRLRADRAERAREARVRNRRAGKGFLNLLRPLGN